MQTKESVIDAMFLPPLPIKQGLKLRVALTLVRQNPVFTTPSYKTRIETAEQPEQMKHMKMFLPPLPIKQGLKQTCSGCNRENSRSFYHPFL